MENGGNAKFKEFLRCGDPLVTSLSHFLLFVDNMVLLMVLIKNMKHAQLSYTDRSYELLVLQEQKQLKLLLAM